MDDFWRYFLSVALCSGRIILPTSLYGHRPLDNIEKLFTRVPMPRQLSVGREADTAHDNFFFLDTQNWLAE
jgi:hypothetical protein